MIFLESKLPGVFEILLEPASDERGFFVRTWCRDEFSSHGLSTKLVQCSTSFNSRKGTLRGLHYQKPPHAEDKLVRCIRGAIYDVVLDLRSDSPLYKSWVAVTLLPNKNMIFIPEGCAHGFLTLEDQCEVSYQMSEFYDVQSACGVRWDDPAFQISWPGTVMVIAERDRTYPDYK
ncbi:MAG: dTDP-4-dehydrorhamnose 3,5-epimerase [Candidatus Acidiferrum sp.]